MSLQNLFVQDAGKSSQDVYCDELVCNSINISGGKQQFVGTATGIWASSQVATIDYEVIGSVCTILLRDVNDTANAVGIINISGIPAAITPSVSQTLDIQIVDNGVQKFGSATVTSGGQIIIYAGAIGQVYAGAGASGYADGSITYLL